MRALLIMIFATGALQLSGQSPIGVWKSIDDTDGKAKSHIEIFEQNGKLHGKVIKLLANADITHCHKCKDDRKGKSLVDMIIIKDMKSTDDAWDHGLILDPAKGKEYKCKISLKDENTLNVRGYIGQPIFGRTQHWYRVTDSE
ncbi:MAG: DUF2147 domain-containing protein [Saprospiraceae bacterium]|nr:DUF2147 domain-containing protein [Saprospiraceae bacterium]